MYEELKELLKHEVREIMNSPFLLMLMLKLYSQIFLNSAPCSSCESKHAGYIARLHREGKEQIKRNNIMKKENEFKLIPGIIMHTSEGMFSEKTITDQISVRLCKKSPALRGNYINPPELGQKTVEVPVGKIVVPESKTEDVKAPEVPKVAKPKTAKKQPSKAKK